MGALKSGAFPVELNGKEYGLLFSLNALDEMQEKFGGYDKLSEVFNKDNPNLFKDTRWLLTLLINEALLAEDENAQLLEEKRVGRLIHAGNLQEVQNAIFKSFYRGTAGDNSDTENENDGEETTEEGNRAAVGMKFVAGDVSGTVQGVTHIQTDEAAAAGEAGNDRTALTLSKAVKAGCKVIALERTDTVAGMTTDDIAALKGVLKQYE